MSDIWIVTADTDYEGFTNLRAFTDETQADAFAAECNAYNATIPSAPGVVEDSPENDVEWDKHTADMKAWEAAHPAAGWCTGQYYTYRVQKCALESRPTPEQSGEARDAARYQICEDLCMYFTDTMGDRIGISLPIPDHPPMKSTAEVFRWIIDAAMGGAS